LSSKTGLTLTVGLPSLVHERRYSLPDTGVTPAKWAIAQGANLLTRSPFGSAALTVRGLVEYAWDEHGVGIGALGQVVYDPRPDSWLWQNTALKDIYGSRASSASSSQQHGGARGIPVYSSYGSLPPGTAVHKAGWNPDTSDFFKKKGKHHCKKGYTLAKVGGAMMCIKLPGKK